MKRLLTFGGVLLIGIGGGFIWGFQTHRLRLFPLTEVRRLIRGPEPSNRTELFPERRADEAVISLPYVEGTADPDLARSGVLTWDRDRAWPGLTLYSSRSLGNIYLVDMRGRLIHRWANPEIEQVQMAVALPNGDLVGIEKDEMLFRMDAEGTLVWSLAIRAHHSIEIDEEGHYWFLAREDRPAGEYHPELEVVEDYIVELSQDGTILQKISVLAILEQSPWKGLIPTVWHQKFKSHPDSPRPVIDMLHPNQLEVFDGSLADRSELYARGNILLSIRNINALMILDGETHEVLWFWGPGNLFAQHHPSLLDDGKILVFNNGVESSSILEVDPLTNRIEWEYSPKRGFYSRRMGSCQRLPNGNTLVTDSESGYLFEITPDGEIVWRFANPDTQDELRLSIYRAIRYPVEYFEFLKRGAEER